MQYVRSRAVTYRNNTQRTCYKEVRKRGPRYRLEDTEIYLTRGVWKGVDWIHLAQIKDQEPLLVNTVRNVLDD
jgi:hypothetical protein